jgi:hypothetical protein
MNLRMISPAKLELEMVLRKSGYQRGQGEETKKRTLDNWQDDQSSLPPSSIKVVSLAENPSPSSDAEGRTLTRSSAAALNLGVVTGHETPEPDVRTSETTQFSKLSKYRD